VPKRDIRMSDAEIAAFLGRHSGCVFGYNDGGPAPAVRAGTYTLAGGVLRVTAVPAGTAETAGAAVRALRADPRVYLLVEQSPSYYEIGYVGVEGRAGPIGEAGGRLTFDLTPHRAAGASFAKLRDPGG